MKLLMHMCCGPCSIYPVQKVQENYEVTGLYFNPNIHPLSEFEKRKTALTEVSSRLNFNLEIIDDINEELWYQMENKPVDRCSVCYDLRLNETFRYAEKHKYDYVTTSLLVSPYQNHQMIIDKSKVFSKKYGIPFYYEDFRIGYREGQKKAKEMEIYCQKYCGCILSLKERFQEIKKQLK